MAIFTTDPGSPARFDDFDIADFGGSYLYVASATVWRRGNTPFDAGSHLEFQGVGFTYVGGNLTGGTITSITSYSAGAVDFSITGLSMTAATFQAFRLADNTAGFLAAVFAGADDITGSNGEDHLYGYAGADKLTGLDGDDILDGGAGNDTLTGGKGDDLYIIDSVGDVIVETGGSKADAVKSTISVDLTSAAFNGIEAVFLDGAANLDVVGDGSANFILGNTGNNKLSGGYGNDKVFGWDGNDTLDGGVGDDQLVGGAGNDTYYIDSAKDEVIEGDLDAAVDLGGYDTVFSSIKSYTLTDYVEVLTLTGSAVYGYGNELDNKITGNASGNTLDGLAGADTMTGGAGSDWYYVDNIGDKTVETSALDGTDRVKSSVTYTLSQYVEHLSLIGTDKIDATGNGLANQIDGNLKANVIDGQAGDDQLSGSSGDDKLIGGLGNDVLRGQDGNDTLDVSQGNDTVLYEGKFDDLDVILGFDGNPTGGQDVLDLIGLFDDEEIPLADRAARVAIIDNGATVDVWIDLNGDKFVELHVATINTTDAVTLGADVLIGP